MFVAWRIGVGQSRPGRKCEHDCGDRDREQTGERLWANAAYAFLPFVTRRAAEFPPESQTRARQSGGKTP